MPSEKKNIRPQASFTDDYLLYILAHASAAVSDAFHSELAREGISVTTWRILGSLYPDARLNVGTLARKTLLKQPTLTRALDRLTAQGVVRRDHSTGDRRGVLVELTETGRTMARAATDKARAHETLILEGYAPSEIADLKRRLRALMAAVRRGPQALHN